MNLNLENFVLGLIIVIGIKSFVYFFNEIFFFLYDYKFFLYLVIVLEGWDSFFKFFLYFCLF